MAIKKDITFDKILSDYREKYDVDRLENPNDLANLHSMIRNQLIMEKLQTRLDDLAKNEEFDSMELKKLLDGIRSLSETNVQLEKTLGIDRKTRKNEQAQSFPDYLKELKVLGREFIESRLTKVFCKNGCSIMLGRVSSAYDTNEYSAAFQCPQCKKYTTVTRKEKDIFFDVKNADWRRKYPMEVVQAKRSKSPEIDVLDDVLLSNDDDVVIEPSE